MSHSLSARRPARLARRAWCSTALGWAVGAAAGLASVAVAAADAAAAAGQAAHAPVARTSAAPNPRAAAAATAPALPAGTKAAASAAPAPNARAVPAGAADVAAAPQTLSDPVEELRQRLTQRLAAAPSAQGTLAVRLQTPSASADGGDGRSASAREAGPRGRQPGGVTPAPTPAAKPAGAAHAPAGKAAAGGAAADSHAGGGGWSYDGAGGPGAWGSMRPEFRLCANGRRQSPIDIRGALPVDLEPVSFVYRPSSFVVVDNGHTVQTDVAPGSRIEIGGRRYDLVQFHFHRPAEERIDGRGFEMSLHLVHRDERGELAVVAVLIEHGAPLPALQQVWRNLPLERQEPVVASAALDLDGLLPQDRRFYTYMGSLTTPPCSEGVRWIVLRQPVTASLPQIEFFARLYPMNARPLQALAGRRILHTP